MTQRLSTAKAEYKLATEALDAATALLHVEEKEAARLEADLATTKSKAKGLSALSAFSTIVAEKERKEADVAQADWQVRKIPLKFRLK